MRLTLEPYELDALCDLAPPALTLYAADLVRRTTLTDVERHADERLRSYRRTLDHLAAQVTDLLALREAGDKIFPEQAQRIVGLMYELKAVARDERAPAVVRSDADKLCDPLTELMLNG